MLLSHYLFFFFRSFFLSLFYSFFLFALVFFSFYSLIFYVPSLSKSVKMDLFGSVAARSHVRFVRDFCLTTDPVTLVELLQPV